jgi:hypothetical protein
MTISGLPGWLALKGEYWVMPAAELQIWPASGRPGSFGLVPILLQMSLRHLIDGATRISFGVVGPPENPSSLGVASPLRANWFHKDKGGGGVEPVLDLRVGTGPFFDGGKCLQSAQH